MLLGSMEDGQCTVGEKEGKGREHNGRRLDDGIDNSNLEAHHQIPQDEG